MIANVTAAALRHLARSRLHVLVSVGGLAVGLCTALIAALVIRNQYTYDHFLPHWERTYVVEAAFAPPGLKPEYADLTLLSTAERLRAQSPAVEAVTRALGESQRLRVGDRRFREVVHWVDANFFDVLPFPALAGNPADAVGRADGVVLSRGQARRLFGRDAPLGETLIVEDTPMVVRAVIQDPPPNGTHVAREILASGLAGHSPMHQKPESGANDFLGTEVLGSGLTYVRLKDGASAAPLRALLADLTQPRNPAEPKMLSLELSRIDRHNTHEGRHPGFRSRMLMLALLGAVVLLIATVNFVNLQTARAARRAREVAVRKLAGCGRGILVLQFLGEALLYAALAALLAIALVEWLLPHVNAFLDSGARLGFRDEPWLMAVIGGMVLLLGLLSGAWPAFVLSGFRPGAVFRGETLAGAGAVRARQMLVTLQFALLIALAICAGVVHLQRQFAMTEGLRLDGEHVLIVHAPGTPAFAGEVRKLPGVRAVTRAASPFLGSTGFSSARGGVRGVSIFSTRAASGHTVSMNTIGADPDLFDFYGVKPLAGTLPGIGDPSPRRVPAGEVVLNESAVRALELGTPSEAIGKAVPFPPPGQRSDPGNPRQATLLAVVPDFTLSPVTEPIPPMVYFHPPEDSESQLELVNVRLAGNRVPETLAAIDALWQRIGEAGQHQGEPPLRFFLDEHVQNHYVGVLRQAEAFGICALTAIVLAGIGLFALTAAAAERRTREIGLRKALGAQTGAIVRLLLWQFTRPVLWGALLAWPAAAWLMHRWLQGFAYRIELPLWLFPTATLLAVAIALLTVTGHTLAVARTRPALSLRHV